MVFATHISQMDTCCNKSTWCFERGVGSKTQFFADIKLNAHPVTRIPIQV